MTTFEELQHQIGHRIGIAVMPLSPSATPQVMGAWTTGPAWSTIKVPIAQAALNAHVANPTAVREAITASDNGSAATLWSSLGGTATAGARVQQILRSSGDPSTIVNTVTNTKFSPYGQTNWSLADQCRFLSGYSKNPDSQQVLGLMGQVRADQRWGLGSINGAKFKGGWGPDANGVYQLRQMGIIDTPNGPVAVALALDSPDGFEPGQKDANAIAQWIKENAGQFATGKPTPGQGDNPTGTGDAVIKTDKDTANPTYTATQGALSEHAATVADPDPTGLEDPQIAGALKSRVTGVRAHLAEADGTLQTGQNAGTAFADTAQDGANVIGQTPVPAMMTGSPTSATAATPAPYSPAMSPAAPTAANPFSMGAPTGIPQLPSFSIPSLGSGAPARVRPAHAVRPLSRNNHVPLSSVKRPGSLNANSSPQQMLAAVVYEGLRRGYSLDQSLACGATMLQECDGNPKAVSSNGLWVGPFQQDAGYAGRNDPNSAIAEFYDRLGTKGGPASPDIWKSIFWLQQRPGAESADAAFAGGRQAYLTEIQSKYGRAVSLWRESQASPSSML